VDYVLNIQALELDPAAASSEDGVAGENATSVPVVLHQLTRVVRERDAYAGTVLDLAIAADQDSSDCSSSGTGASSVCNGDVCARKLPECQQHGIFDLFWVRYIKYIGVF